MSVDKTEPPVSATPEVTEAASEEIEFDTIEIETAADEIEIEFDSSDDDAPTTASEVSEVETAPEPEAEVNEVETAPEPEASEVKEEAAVEIETAASDDDVEFSSNNQSKETSQDDIDNLFG